MIARLNCRRERAIAGLRHLHRSPGGGAALRCRRRAVWNGPGGAAASAQLLPQIRRLLQQAGVELAQLQAIAFGNGPGAFTGLRTACAVAQGLALGAALPVLPVDSLLIVAEGVRAEHRDAPADIDVVMDARMGEVYAGRYRWAGGRWQCHVAPALRTLDGAACAVGAAAAAVRGRLGACRPSASACTAVTRCAWPDDIDRAAALLRVAQQLWHERGGIDAAQALPLYLRDKVAMTVAEREALRRPRLPMSALLQARTAAARRCTYADLDAVLAVERAAYSFPWTRGNFVDSLAVGYLAELLVSDGDGLVGYYVAMPGVDEMHLLNLTVAPRAAAARPCAHAARRAAAALPASRRLPKLWLEVRASNARARQIYARRGFAEVGLRRGYYPAGKAQREDAIVMSLDLQARAHELDRTPAADAAGDGPARVGAGACRARPPHAAPDVRSDAPAGDAARAGSAARRTRLRRAAAAAVRAGRPRRRHRRHALAGAARGGGRVHAPAACASRAGRRCSASAIRTRTG